MQFLILAHDYNDEDALARRLAAREAHLAYTDAAAKRGEKIIGAALLNENGQMCGSVMIANVNSRADIDKWLEKEPYILGKVWEKVEITPCKIGPSFANLCPSTNL